MLGSGRLAQAGFAPRIAYEVDDLIAAQAFAAAGIAVVLMHGLTVGAPLAGVAVRPLADGAEGSRAVEAVLATGGGSPAARALLGHLVAGARYRERARVLPG